MESIDGLLFFIGAIAFIGTILFVMVLAGGFSQVEHDVDMPLHEYTEDEYISLFNYCINKRNAKANEYPSVINQQKIYNMDKILDDCRQQYENPYYPINYTNLCEKLLSLLNHDEQEKIHYGILK